ncbi:MAG: hypothetical protein NTZ49_03365 [Candidatus Parcubacteria bacterium]|nr:hypothetical protein [Candidatus Parcubacteria bacterium]
MNKLSKIILFLLLLGLFLPYLPAQAAGNAIFRLTSAKTDYYVGENIYIDVMVEPNGESINTVRLISDFTGADVLNVSDFNLGTAWPTQSPGRELNNTTDHINVGGFILVESINVNSKFGTLIFKANQIGTSTISVATGSHLISPDQIERLNIFASQNITINVIGNPPLPPPPPPANHAPVFSAIANKQINLGETITFPVSATDSDNDLINLSWTIPSSANFNNVINDSAAVSGNFSWTPASQGIYTVTFTATDNNVDAKTSVLTVGIGVNVPAPAQNHAPVFEPILEKTVNAGEILTFTVSATDPDGDNVTLSLEPLETASLTPITSGITSSSRFSWTPKNFGIYYLVFKAKDDNAASQESTQTVRITVFGGQCPPCSSGGGGGGATCPIPQCEKQDFKKPINKTLPVITSPTHPSQEIWYSKNTPQFVWEVAEENLGYVFNIDQNPLSDPAIGYFFSQDKVFSFSQVADGFWYFHLKVKYSDGYGPTAHYQVKIDTTAPEFFLPSIEGTKLYFSAIDKHSGLAYFEMKTDDGKWQKIQSPYTFTSEDQNAKVMTLRAVDNSGNAIEARIDLPKMELIKEEPKKYILNQPKFIIEPLIIDKIDFPVIRGRAMPSAKVFLFISTEPQTIIYTLADYQGNWVAYADKELAPAKYSIYGIANLNFTDSPPSEKVYFSITKEQQKFIFHWSSTWPWWILMLLVIISGAVAIYLLLKVKKYYLTKRIFRKAYKIGKHDGKIIEKINEIKQQKNQLKKIAAKSKNRR